jgi:arsenate reductase-like glutaredoxin family protein
VDLAQKGMSAGELRNVAARVGGMEALIDRAGKRYVDKGLKYAAPTGPRIEQILVDDPLLLRTPIARSGARATVGYAPEVWTAWIDEQKRGG